MKDPDRLISELEEKVYAQPERIQAAGRFFCVAFFIAKRERTSAFDLCRYEEAMKIVSPYSA